MNKYHHRMHFGNPTDKHYTTVTIFTEMIIHKLQYSDNQFRHIFVVPFRNGLKYK